MFLWVCCFESPSCYVAQAGRELMILLSCSPYTARVMGMLCHAWIYIYVLVPSMKSLGQLSKTSQKHGRIKSKKWAVVVHSSRHMLKMRQGSSSLCVVAQNYNSSAQEFKAGGLPQVHCYPGLYRELWASLGYVRIPCIEVPKTKMKKKTKQLRI